jgi:hydrogenase expression/formation protein HypD
LECRLFKKICQPENPIGPCMVSIEGTCHTYFRFSN